MTMRVSITSIMSIGYSMLAQLLGRGGEGKKREAESSTYIFEVDKGITDAETKLV